jgi:ketosteroid isomerase-like protein
MTTPEDSIRARRRLSNKVIAAHDPAKLKAFFSADAQLIPGAGGLILGADAIVAAFAGQFADPDFQTYIRTTATVEIDRSGDRAAEAGTWVAHWKDRDITGRYLAAWRKVIGQWVIESELFVTLSE